MLIMHLSDTHFGNDGPAFDPCELQSSFNKLSDIIKKKDTYMVVSGDITFKGKTKGYEQAKKFFDKIWLKNGGDKNRFLACPGNHDICNNSFDNFHAFLYYIRETNEIDFSKRTSFLVEGDGVAFLLVNSSYHFDHKYGLIDCDYLSKILEEKKSYLDEVKHKIAVIHHHLIGIQSDDTSTIRNAFRFLALLDKFAFKLILHGHQHLQASLKIGNAQMDIFSGRSLNYPTHGFVNGISLISNSKDGWDYLPQVLSADNSLIEGLIFKPMGK